MSLYYYINNRLDQKNYWNGLLNLVIYIYDLIAAYGAIQMCFDWLIDNRRFSAFQTYQVQMRVKTAWSLIYLFAQLKKSSFICQSNAIYKEQKIRR